MKIGIFGYTGRVGQLLVNELLTGDHDLELAGGCAPDAGDAVYFTTTSPEALIDKSDVLIDFTRPEATIAHIKCCADKGKAIVIGTTGLSEADEKTLQEAAKKIPVLYAANMSLGVNMLLALVEQAASRLGSDWDIEIFESHHKHKVDAPSGTALALGKAAQKGRGSGDFAIDRNGKRKQGDIGFAVQRGGDIVGEHDVTFYADGERITLSHKATNRALFARGALHGAAWLHSQPAGLYAMRDVLGL